MTRPGPRGDAGKAVLLRLTAEEHATMSAAAKRAGLGVGPWLRMLGLAHATEITVTGLDIKEHRRQTGCTTPGPGHLAHECRLPPAARRVASRRKAP